MESLMKKVTATVLGAVMVVSSTVAAAASTGVPVGDAHTMHFQPATASSVHMLDPIELETTRAGIAAPLALALGIASFDLALAGFFWGVYVPNYAPRNPSFYTEVFSN